MSPFGRNAMLQGFLKSSTKVTTLKVSPGGPGGCACVRPLKPKMAAAPMATACIREARAMRRQVRNVVFIVEYPMSVARCKCVILSRIRDIARIVALEPRHCRAGGLLGMFTEH